MFDKLKNVFSNNKSKKNEDLFNISLPFEPPKFILELIAEYEPKYQKDSEKTINELKNKQLLEVNEIVVNTKLLINKHISKTKKIETLQGLISSINKQNVKIKKYKYGLIVTSAFLSIDGNMEFKEYLAEVKLQMEDIIKQKEEKIVMEGEVTDVAGNILSNFNGHVYPTVFDKPQTVNTLANDAGSTVTSFQTQTNVLFKGKASVTNGLFSFTFKVPKDINYQFGNGKLSLYAEDGTKDANGFFTNFIVGGQGNTIDGDNEGPEIKPYLNDELFANGGIANQNPILLVKLTDSSGINTAGTGIGHDIVATLDNDNRRFFILNDFYQGDLNSYQKGVVRFQLPELEAGPHTLKIKAWDVLNNSNERILDFIVAKDEELELSHVLNYPNPFTTSTNFWFEHNKPGQPLQVQLQIMTITGRTVKTFSRTITTEGNRSAEMQWDGKDEFGEKLGRGVYLYKLRVTAPDKKKKEVIEKLVIL